MAREALAWNAATLAAPGSASRTKAGLKACALVVDFKMEDVTGVVRDMHRTLLLAAAAFRRTCGRTSEAMMVSERTVNLESSIHDELRLIQYNNCEMEVATSSRGCFIENAPF